MMSNIKCASITTKNALGVAQQHTFLRKPMSYKARR